MTRNERNISVRKAIGINFKLFLRCKCIRRRDFKNGLFQKRRRREGLNHENTASRVLFSLQQKSFHRFKCKVTFRGRGIP